jgi:hypothetical protein
MKSKSKVRVAAPAAVPVVAVPVVAVPVVAETVAAVVVAPKIAAPTLMIRCCVLALIKLSKAANAEDIPVLHTLSARLAHKTQEPLATLVRLSQSATPESLADVHAAAVPLQHRLGTAYYHAAYERRYETTIETAAAVG